MAKGGWKRRVGLAFIALLTIGIVLAATWRAWTPTAVRLVLKTRGIQVANVKWEGTNLWRFESVERAQNGLIFRAKNITTLRPKAWKTALRAGDTNQTYVTVNGWRVILPQHTTKTADTNTIANKLLALNEGIHRAQEKCPRAVFLNGTLQTARGEFNFGAVEWKGGELSGDFTWPQLNDPADFRLKIADPAKLQLIVRQRALEIGARATSEVLADGARLAGYARWKNNRVDFDVTYPQTNDLPRHARVDSKGLAIPGRFIGMPEVESLNARMRLVITNGHFNFVLGAAETTETSAAQ
ncbi:MAG TPA: hypothetical protein VM680_20325 [Verrucomicrobiae bacterium]|nr:hypothetical protein [Verrucomicrobiae bacterium]